MTAAACLLEYRESVQKIESYIAAAHTVDVTGNYVHGQDYRQFVISSAVVRFSVAWESFLERIFCAFLVGEPDLVGNVVPCCVRAVDEQHAQRLLIGTNTYFDWTNPDKIIQLSELYLERDNPIHTAISSTKNDLIDLKNIRNAAAHVSSTTQTKLDAIASRLFGRQMVGVTVSDVMNFVRADGKTVWTYYKDLLDAAAEGVAKGQV